MRRCGICRGTGHNRQTCQKNKMRSAAHPASQPITTNNPETPTRTASGRRKPSCSYCRTRNFKVDRTHTCRSCPSRKTDLAAWIEENKIWARDHKKRMMNLGFGVGALVQYAETVLEVESAHYEDISKSGVNGYYGKHISEEKRVLSRIWIGPDNFDYEIVSRIPANMVAAQFPKDWESGTYGVPWRLKDSRKARKPNKK